MLIASFSRSLLFFFLLFEEKKIKNIDFIVLALSVNTIKSIEAFTGPHTHTPIHFITLSMKWYWGTWGGHRRFPPPPPPFSRGGGKIFFLIQYSIISELRRVAPARQRAGHTIYRVAASVSEIHMRRLALLVPPLGPFCWFFYTGLSFLTSVNSLVRMEDKRDNYLSRRASLYSMQFSGNNQIGSIQGAIGFIFFSYKAYKTIGYSILGFERYCYWGILWLGFCKSPYNNQIRFLSPGPSKKKLKIQLWTLDGSQVL